MAVKHGVVELTVPVVDPNEDEPEALAHAVRDVMFDHQYQVMTDPTILDPDDLDVATCLESRAPLPEATHAALHSLGFAPQGSEPGGDQGSSLFSRFRKRQRTKLDRWAFLYGRTKGMARSLYDFESSLIEEVPEGSLPELADDASRALADAARTYFRALVVPDLNGLQQVERRILEARGPDRRKWVLHPAAVRALAAFTGECVRAIAPGSRWVDDPDGEPLWVRTTSGQTVRTDPELRVVQLVARGSKALLSTYVQSICTQSA